MMKTCKLLSFPQIKYYVGMGAHRVLVSLPDFKSGVAAQKVAGWVRFPHAPAKKNSSATPATYHAQISDEIFLSSHCKRISFMLLI